jgi:hypothetical protein
MTTTTTITTTSARPDAHMAEWERELLKAMNEFANDEWQQIEMCVEVEGIHTLARFELKTNVFRLRPGPRNLAGT